MKKEIKYLLFAVSALLESGLFIEFYETKLGLNQCSEDISVNWVKFSQKVIVF